MVIMDEMGDKIQVVVKKDELVTWQSKLKENTTYVMHNFKVVCNDGQYKVCDHKYKLLFTGGTTLREQNLPDFPLNVFKFKSFHDISSGKFHRDMLTKITYQQVNANPKKVVFNMKDLSGEILSCTLSEKHALKLLTYVSQKHDSVSIIILLTQARIKEAQEGFPVLLSNSWHGSKLFINDGIPEITTFKDSYDASHAHEISTQSEGLSEGLSQRLTQLSASSSQFSEKGRFMYKAEVMSISEINKLAKDTTCVTVGTTGKFVVGKSGWYYEACSKCNKKANVHKAFTCSYGKHNDKSVPRYKLEMEVYHKQHNANFIFWNRECAELIGNSALELKNLMIECGEDDPKLYPEPLDKMLGCTLAFRVKVQPSFGSSSVMKVSPNPKLIQAISEQMGYHEKTCETDKAMSNVNEVIDYATLRQIQSFSATGDHDPEFEVTLTPAKRLSSEMQIEDSLSQDLASGQLSSTKMAKHIKTE